MEKELLDRIGTTFDLHKKHKVLMKNTSAEYRLSKIRKFKKLMLAKKEEISLALSQDFHKPKIESELTEILPVLSMINLLEKKLSGWMKEKKIPTPLLFKGAKSSIRYEGKGNVLVIAPWNYPFQLTVYPILTSFASGNTTIVKPSEYTGHVNKVIMNLFEEVFSTQEVQFFEGESDISTELLKLPFDHIFFTGSTNVGKVIMEAAAKNLASVSLELGGKSPAILDKTADIVSSTKKIAWGKLVNGGQTCVAPDYLLVHKSEQNIVLDELINHIESFYGVSGSDTKWDEVKDLAHIITERHAERLNTLVEDAVAKGAEIKFGGKYYAGKRVLSPTILTNVTKEMRVMQEEIFGPILPVIGKENLEEMVNYINDFDNSLALYAFSNNQINIDYILDHTASGGVTVNDVLINLGHPSLPFGGAGKSGLGNYHGHYGFEEFSNLRPVMKRSLDLGTSYFYPPYTSKKESIVSSLLKKFSKIL